MGKAVFDRGYFMNVFNRSFPHLCNQSIILCQGSGKQQIPGNSEFIEIPNLKKNAEYLENVV